MISKKITSLSNPLVAKAVDVRLGRRSGEKNILLAEGPHLVGMAAASGAMIQEIFYTESFGRSEEGSAMIEQLTRVAAPVRTAVEVTDRVLAKISDTESPQGIVALVTYSAVELESLQLKGAALIAVCDGIRDPGNLGTIIRVADASGADAVVVLHGSCNPTLPKVVRATAGSIFSIPVITTGCAELAGFLSLRKIRLIITDIRADRSLYQLDLRGPLAFAFGNEARGVGADLTAGRAESIRIPIFGKAESLNVGSAAAVCLYEAARQRIR